MATSTSKSIMAQQVANAARDFQVQRTGHAPKAVTVVLSDDTLVVTLHEALSPAEKDLARSPGGAAQVQDFHRQLFKSSLDSLRQEIQRITGVAVREATAEVETTTGAVVHVFTSGTMVQVFQLAQSVAAETWNGNGPSESAVSTDVPPVQRIGGKGIDHVLDISVPNIHDGDGHSSARP